jgi:SWI/SNF-related matrix-associated actin-dependent regulator of chromatin subfamily A-like protein 1
MINRFRGRCPCGARVEPGHGEAVKAPDGKWGVVCRLCSGPVVKRGSVALGISFDGFVTAAPSSHTFGPKSFEIFTQAARAAGFRFQRALARNICPLDHFPGVAPALARYGFAVEISEQLRVALALKAAGMRDEIKSADERMAAIAAALAKEGRALWKFQPEGVAFLALRKAGVLYDEPGLGKTVQTLAALPYGAPVLAVGPAAAREVWTRHVPLWRPDLTASALEGLKSFRWPRPGELLATTWACLPPCEEANGRLIAPEGAAEGTVIIADEAHGLLNPETRMTRRFRAVARAASTAGGRVYLLTGTPVLNARPPEMWALLDAAPGLAAEAFGDWPHYVALWGGHIDAEGRTHFPRHARPSPEIAERFRRVALGRKRRDVLGDLPPDRDEDVHVEIAPTPDLLSALREAEADYDKLAAEIAADARGELSDLGSGEELRFGALAKARRALASAKLPAAVEIVKEYERLGEPVVVFCSHREPMEHLAARKGWALIAGGVDARKRGALEDEFQAGRLRGLAVTIKAGGVALTLTRAAFGLFLDWDWVPAFNEQARARLVRGTQTRGVLFRHLIARDHPLDERLRKTCARKAAVNEKTTGGSAPAASAAERIAAFEGA